MYKLFISAFLITGMALSSQAISRELELADYLDWETVSGPQISPDGSFIIYTRRSADKMSDSWISEVWQMDADGGRNRFLTTGGNVQFSPSGDRIAYIGQADGHSQVFVRYLDAESSVTQITHQQYRINGLAWAPDGKTLAIRAAIPIKPSWKINMPPKPKGAEWTGDPRITDRLFYRRDRAGFIDAFNHLFVVPADGGTPRQLTEGNWSAGGNLEWTPDGSAILFTGEIIEEGDPNGMRSNIYAVEVATKEISQLNITDGGWNNPKVSPDGSQIAYLGNSSVSVRDVTFPPVELHIMNRDGSEDRTVVADIGNGVRDMRWTDDGQGLYLSYGRAGSSNVRLLALDGSFSEVTTGEHIFNLSSVSDTGMGVGVFSSSHVTSNVASINMADGTITQLTDVNGDILADVELGAVEEIWYESFDGQRIQGWVVFPPDFDASRQYPLLLSIHGGPHGMYGVGFNYSFQEFAARGYVVLYTNPRGSTGYGWEFANAINNQYPGPVDMGDMMAGVDVMLGRGYVDAKRQYVQGCSGGGILTSYIVTQTDRFAAAVTRCPIVNWISAGGTSDVPLGVHNLFDKPFWEDPQDWYDHSAIFHVNNVKTPTLIMVGEQDLRTPVPQSEEFFVALRMLGVPTKLIRMKKQWHGTSSLPSNMLRTQLYMQSWFDSYGGGAEGTSEEAEED